jgi:hypothetical protein
MSSRREYLAENQLAFRTANERFAERAEKLVSDETPVPFLCECADERCLARIELSLAQYREVREHPGRFLILPGHPTPEEENVVGDNGRFHVVEEGEG